MELENEMRISAAIPKSAALNKNLNESPTSSFSDVMSAQNVEDKNIAQRDAVLANQAPRETNVNKEDMDYIHEHGMQAYADKVKAEKIEELREKLMEAMGLTEEILSAMSPQQRKTIEDLIDNNIQQQIATASFMNTDQEDKSIYTADIDMTWNTTKKQLQSKLIADAAAVSGAPNATGTGAGDSMIDIIERSQTLETEEEKG